MTEPLWPSKTEISLPSADFFYAYATGLMRWETDILRICFCKRIHRFNFIRTRLTCLAWLCKSCSLIGEVNIRAENRKVTVHSFTQWVERLGTRLCNSVSQLNGSDLRMRMGAILTLACVWCQGFILNSFLTALSDIMNGDSNAG